jgi:hypothetical protein
VANTNTIFTPSSGWSQIETKSDGSFHEQSTQDQMVTSMGRYASTGTESPAAFSTVSVMAAFRAATAATTTLNLPTVTAAQALSSFSRVPAGQTGTLVFNRAGSLNFAAAQSRDGVAYYKFTGAPVETVFNTDQGQISFNLTSRYSFAQRQASGSARFAFDVRDQDPNNHLYYFSTQSRGEYLLFSYAVNNVPQFYYVPKGTEDTLFGSGVTLKVTVSWDGSNVALYLNDELVQSAPYTKPTPNWTAASTFDIGAYEYLNYGGFNACDDVIDAFSVAPVTHP